jgi:hypothetical protein
MGAFADWWYAWIATPLAHLDPIFHGTCVAALELAKGNPVP